jgi:hypothetical protein
MTRHATLTPNREQKIEKKGEKGKRRRFRRGKTKEKKEARFSIYFNITKKKKT